MVDIDPTSGPSAGDEETRTRRTRVVVIGAGFGGIGTAVRLKQSGIDDFVVLERAAEPGGTWQVTITARRGGQVIGTRQMSVNATGGM